MADRSVRIVLLGKSVSENSGVGNFLLGRAAFYSEAPPDVVERVGGRLKNRHMMVINCPQLLQANISDHQITRIVRECVYLSDPGPHVIVLLLKHNQCSTEDQKCVEKVLDSFSELVYQHTMVFTTQELTETNDTLQKIIQKCSNRHFSLQRSSSPDELLQMFEDIVQMNDGRHLVCAEYEASQHFTMEQQATERRVLCDLRIVLLGKTGVGKSATGNTILRRRAFKSLFDPSSVTRECKKETTEVNRRRITVLNTPGLFDTGVDNAETRKEIVKCVSMAAPGPHVFLLVMQLGRFTQQDKDTVKMIQETFGDKSRMYTMVLFTRGDNLEGRIEDFIEGDGSLKNITQQFGKRYHVFNNKNTEDETQVSELLDKIDCLIKTNGGSFYTNEMFQQVEKNIKEAQERILKEKEEELRTKYEAEIEEMKKGNKREREEMQNELRKREENFKKREEEIKKETDANLRKELHRKLEEQQKQFEEENKRKEKALGEQQQNFIKYLEEQHEKEKHNLQEKIQCETREEAEQEYGQKLVIAVARAFQEAEESLPYRSRRARDWGRYLSVVGGAVGGLVGTIEDIVYWILSLCSEGQVRKQNVA